MKKPLLAAGITLALASCGADAPKQGESQTIALENVRLGDVVQDSLTPAQVEKISRIQATFAEVYPVSLAETITDFRRDQHPDQEIATWLTMAAAYEKYVASQPKTFRPEARKEVFSLLLTRSMMPAAQVIAKSRLMFLSAPEAETVLSLYDAVPHPIQVSPE